VAPQYAVAAAVSAPFFLLHAVFAQAAADADAVAPPAAAQRKCALCHEYGHRKNHRADNKRFHLNL
jgi:hypothetical protein